ncbi:MAG TPA: hypothetical protein VGI92_11595 [Gemmatimonadales bacterium]|jgi:hypothetical protein
MVREMIPAVQHATGMTFHRQPVVALRSRDQLGAYLEAKARSEFPPAEVQAQSRAYKLLRLVPDTMDLMKTQIDLLRQQVLGFYDPDSSALFVIRGGDPLALKIVIAHELVHALQDQYTHLNAILKMRRQNDRQMAGQAVMEGQATVAGLIAINPSVSLDQLSQVFEAAQQKVGSSDMADVPGMAALTNAPRMLREDLVFPYYSGAQFIIGFDGRRANESDEPFGDRLPISTEQILHASKYTAHETPAAVAIGPSPGDTLLYDDDFGEFDTRVALETWGVSLDDAAQAASGWNGDRYALFGSRTGPALVWASAFDTEQDAAEFDRALRRGWDHAAQGRPNAAARKWQVDTLDIGGVKVVRLVDAPLAWAGWRRLPAVTVSQRSTVNSRR